MAKDINKSSFSNSTLLKLEIFRESFREWLPVFIHGIYFKKVYVIDFFSGSGKDLDGKPGSPLVLLEEARGENRILCSRVKKPIHFLFNDLENKNSELSENISNHILNCKEENGCNECVYKTKIYSQEFKDLFDSSDINNILKNKNFGKFVLLDQYGFKEIDDEVFQKLIHFPKTDFIFFISSSTIKRFKDVDSVKTYIDINNLDFDESNPNECHRIIADYFKQKVPKNKEYYLHHFSFKKGSNYYGLIFGTGHTLGMEKFLKVCWQKDEFSGESNYNIDNDYMPDQLFYDPDKSNKKEECRIIIKDVILSGKINNNVDGLKYTLSLGCLPSLFIEVIKSLQSENKILLSGNLSFCKSDIHRIKNPFFITILNQN